MPEKRYHPDADARILEKKKRNTIVIALARGDILVRHNDDREFEPGRNRENTLVRYP